MIWKIIGAAGSLASILAVCLTLFRLRRRLKITAKREVLESCPYVIRIHNTTNVDSGIESIAFYKGNPGNTSSVILYARQMIEDNNFMRIQKGKSYEVSFLPREIVDGFWIDQDKAFGRPTDKIFIYVTDIFNKHYVIKTGDTCGFIEVIAKHTRSQNENQA